MDELWHPNARRMPLEDAGPFTGGGAKTLWHTAETSSVQVTYDAVKAKRAAPHFIIGRQDGKRILWQCVPLNRAGRALEHNLPQETNRANPIQIEIADYAANSGKWDDEFYNMLGGLAEYIEHHHGTSRGVRGFKSPRKFTGDGFVKFSGHCGHVHVPGNSHTDPGRGFKVAKIIDYLEANA